MTHLQAFHTSCREGLGGISGFQINAASPQLDREQLAALSEAHARYDTPHGLPYEPTVEQMRAFPVSLKSSLVAGVGPVVSRTQYVGREYRGGDGRPDEGRYGNYFCHMVVGQAGDDPFDGLTPVELWDAPHWTTTEATSRTLAPLGQLVPGPVNLADVVRVVTAAPPGVAAALVDGALKAIDGGPPVLIIDPVVDRAVTWLAWITFALPPTMGRALTFSSFEGRPQDVVKLHVVATTPACDGGATVTSRFTRVDVTAAVGPGSPSLFARCVLALANQDSEALASVVRRVRGPRAAAWGASLAIEGGLTELAEDEDIPEVLAQLLVLVGVGRVADAAAAATGLRPFDDGDRRQLAEWAELYVRARRSTAGDAARELASVALGRLITHIDDLPEELPHVPREAPAAPGVGSLGAWLRATEAARGSDRSGRMVKRGVDLGLIGLNVPVDTRVTAVIIDDLERPEMVAALDAIDADGRNDHVIRQVTEAVAAESSSDPRARARLLRLCRYEMTQQTLRRRADELGTFDAAAACQRVRVALNPLVRVDAARVLVALATDRRAAAEIRDLWGEHGPQTAVDVDDLLHVYLDAGRSVPAADRETAFRILMQSPLPTRPPASSIGYTLRALPAEAPPRPELEAWLLAFERPGRGLGLTLARWCDRAVEALRATRSELPDQRWEELFTCAAETLIADRRQPGFSAALLKFERTDFDRLCAEMATVLAREAEASDHRPRFAAREFDLWMRMPVVGLADRVLPEALQRLSGRDIEDAGQFVSPGYVSEWELWSQRHPRTGARAVVARVFGRRGKDRDGDDL